MDDVAMTTAARRLGLEPGEMWLAVELGEVRSVRAPGRARDDTGGGAFGPAGPVGAGAAGCGAAGADWTQRRVPRSELARLRGAVDFPDGLLERLRTVHAGGGAELLGISRTRFARLARAGFFSAVRCHVNRYQAVVWRYRAEELRQFAVRHPELLSGPLPRGLREALAEGADLRAVHWRGRRVAQLCRFAGSRWESAAARAAVLPRDALAAAVPDPAERALLDALRPELTPYRGRTEAVRERLRRLATAAGEDEIFWHRLMLAADLESARAAEPLGGRQPGDGRTAPEPPAPMTALESPVAASVVESPEPVRPVPAAGLPGAANAAGRAPAAGAAVARTSAARTSAARTAGAGGPAARMSAARTSAGSRDPGATPGVVVPATTGAASGARPAAAATAVSAAERSRRRAAAKRARAPLGSRASRRRPVWRRLRRRGTTERPGNRPEERGSPRQRGEGPERAVSASREAPREAGPPPGQAPRRP